MKDFGILLRHIQPGSRAFSSIGLDGIMKGDPVHALKTCFNDTKTVAGLFGAIGETTDKDILAFLNRAYQELDNYSGYGIKEVSSAACVKSNVYPNEISEAVQVLTVFVRARKVKRFAIQMDVFITDNIFTLKFDDPGFTFKAIYEKLPTGNFRRGEISRSRCRCLHDQSIQRNGAERIQKLDKNLYGDNGNGLGKRIVAVIRPSGHQIRKGQSPK